MKIECPYCKHIGMSFVMLLGPSDGFYQSIQGSRSDYRRMKCRKCKRTYDFDFGDGR